MANDWIRIRGARTHNLKNVNVDIPRNKLTVITGLSGSGKSSLAFDTLYAEGQRRYAESVSSYARRFMDVLDKPDVDSIEGLSPSISIEQHTGTLGSRSTVATVTEAADYLRLLFARAGRPYCPEHHVPLSRCGIHDMVDAALKLPEGTKVMILAPVSRDTRLVVGQAAAEMSRRGFVRVRLDGAVSATEELLGDKTDGVHTLEAVVDRLKISDQSRSRLAESFEAAVRLSDGKAILAPMEGNFPEQSFSTRYGCPVCGYSAAEPTPPMFSFNNALGACPKCEGTGRVDQFDPHLVVRDPELSLGEGAVCGWSPKSRANWQILERLADKMGFNLAAPWKKLSPEVQHFILYGDGREGGFTGVIGALDHDWERKRSEAARVGLKQMRTVSVCPECGGARYRKEVLDVYLGEGDTRVNIAELTAMSLTDARDTLRELTFSPERKAVAEGPVAELLKRLAFLCDVGLGYLTLNREASTLSGGEMQRIRLAGQIGSGLTGVTYVLDEPTIGLHQRDNEKLIAMMKRLSEAGNTVVAVEHDIDVIRAADYIVDIGPGAGEHGGEVIAQGTPAEVAQNPASKTGAYLSGRARVEDDGKGRPKEMTQFLTLEGARGHNLKNLTCHFPVGAVTVVTGVSGSGKSTLVNDTLGAALRRHFNHTKERPLEYDRIDGLDLIDKVIDVDQSPIGKTPRSNPAIYTGLFTSIRDIFAQTPAAIERGYDSGRFSFNTPGGRCEACEGDGVIKIEMGFLPPVYVTCSTCQGRRYNRETLEVKYKGKNICDVLNMTASEAADFFSAFPAVSRKLRTLEEVGLGYIRLGQSAVTFSGGEAQRIKIAEELSRRDTGSTLYILDEPTTGLHFDDVAALMKVLRKLTALGNTVIVIEHNLDVIRLADWIVDIGPDGGARGGELVVEGPADVIAACPASLTGKYLREELARTGVKPAKKSASRKKAAA